MRRIQLDSSLVGTVVERDFTVLEWLGAGGMGATFRAKQHSLQREVCLKFLAIASLSELESVQRFKREARVLGRLKHPGIVQVYSFGIFERVYPFLVMELVEGRSLRKELQGGAIDWARSCRLLGQTSAALQYAHNHGFVHRDVKPDNIMLIGEPGFEKVKLIDFGLAGKLSSISGFETLTNTGTTVGTPHYMSPEAFSGSAGSAGDIYALGCVLYECLTGIRPFEADNPVGVMRNHMTSCLPPLPPSSSTPEIRKALDQIIGKATAKKTSDRFRDCRALSLALERVETSTTDTFEIDDTSNVPGRNHHRFVRYTSFTLAFAIAILCAGAFLENKDRSSAKVVNVFDQALIDLRQRDKDPDDASVKNQISTLTRNCKNLSLGWQSASGAHDVTNLDRATSDYLSSLLRFLLGDARVLARTPKFLPQVRSLSLEISRLRESFPANKSEFRSRLDDLQCDLFVSAGAYKSALGLLQSKHHSVVNIRQDPLSDFRVLHLGVRKLIADKAEPSLSWRLRPAAERYSELSDGAELFGEFLSWYKGGCTQNANKHYNEKTLFQTAKRIKFASQSQAAAALLTLIKIERAEGHLDQARIALDSWERTCSPTLSTIEDFARLSQETDKTESAYRFLGKERDSAERRGDDYLWCKLESLRLLTTQDFSSLPRETRDFFLSSHWRESSGQWALVKMVVTSVVDAAERSATKGHRKQALEVLEECQKVVLSQRTRLKSGHKDRPFLREYGQLMYATIQAFSRVDGFQESLLLRQEYLNFVDKNIAMLPDGFLPFAAKLELARALWSDGNYREAGALYNWCGENFSVLPGSPPPKGWRSWLHNRRKWFELAGRADLARRIETDIYRTTEQFP
ncbi:MAG: serine/threonine protein kinase [Candidatus Obscuribacterales bacterium]|nr:serine/threonine protein kinase [Candidatus Obscuribacterales bacterium]